MQVDALGRRDVADNTPADRNRPCRQVGLDRRPGPDRQIMRTHLNGALDLAVDRQVLFADDTPFDAERASNPRRDATLVGPGIQVIGHPESSLVSRFLSGDSRKPFPTARWGRPPG